MATLGTLAAQLAQLLDRDNEDEFPTKTRYWCVNRAIEEIVRLPHSRWGDVYQTLTWPAGNASVALSDIQPTLYEVKAVSYRNTDAAENSDPVPLIRLNMYDYALWVGRFQEDGPHWPAAFSQIGTALFVAPVPTSDVEMTVIGRACLPELQNESDHNGVTDTHPELVLWLAVTRASTFFPGELEIDQIAQVKAQQMLTDLEIEETRSSMSVRGRDGIEV